MRVLLRNPFFSRLGRFRKSVPATEPVEIPDELRDELPSSAKIVDDDYVAPSQVATPVETMSAAAQIMGLDPERDEMEAAARIAGDAEANVAAAAEKYDSPEADDEAEEQRRKAEEFKAQLAAEKSNARGAKAPAKKK